MSLTLTTVQFSEVLKSVGVDKIDFRHEAVSSGLLRTVLGFLGDGVRGLLFDFRSTSTLKTGVESSVSDESRWITRTTRVVAGCI